MLNTGRSKTTTVKYRTIRVREEVAAQLDEWRDIFEDSSLSEVMWRIFALATRELKRVKEEKVKAREKFVKDRKLSKETPKDGVE
jgi:hypothetical protein